MVKNGVGPLGEEIEAIAEQSAFVHERCTETRAPEQRQTGWDAALARYGPIGSLSLPSPAKIEYA